MSGDLKRYGKDVHKQMMIPEYITGPLVGGIIGCFTNFIAVKMLFYPRKEIRIFGHVLPFTPGAIPKGKPRLAESIGNAVANSLLTRQDIEDMLLSAEIEEEIADAMMEHLTKGLKTEICSLSGISDERYDEKKAELCALISREIAGSIDIPGLMEAHGKEYLKERIYSHKLGRLISTDRIESIAMSIADDLQDIVEEKGDTYIQPIVAQKMSEADAHSVQEILIYAGMREERLRKGIIETYKTIAKDNADKLLSHIDIAGIISDKINAMEIEELERLILTVMKKELRTIISLGGLIGIILGLLNCLPM